MQRTPGFVLLLFMASALLWATEANAQLQPFIKAHPSQCITTEPQCHIDLLLSWQAKDNESLCLVILGDSRQEICDIPSRARDYPIHLDSADDAAVLLVRKYDKHEVASVMIEVQLHHAHRKRRKVAWSIF